jgi:hypothetical protein
MSLYSLTYNFQLLKWVASLCSMYVLRTKSVSSRVIRCHCLCLLYEYFIVKLRLSISTYKVLIQLFDCFDLPVSYDAWPLQAPLIL